MRDNKLLSRKELAITVLHAGAAVPDRETLRSKIAELYQTGKDRIVVSSFKNRYGTHRTTLSAKIYSNADALESTEMRHVVTKLTGKEFKTVPRRVRKDERKKRYKMFGTLKRSMKKAERKNK